MILNFLFHESATYQNKSENWIYGCSAAAIQTTTHVLGHSVVCVHYLPGARESPSSKGESRKCVATERGTPLLKTRMFLVKSP